MDTRRRSGQRLTLGTLLLLCGTLCVTTPARAQFLDPDNQITCWSCYGHRYHFMTGAVIDLAIRPAPFFAKSWRQSPALRVATVAALGSLYELNNYFGICAPPQNDWRCGVGGRGFSLLGLAYDLAARRGRSCSQRPSRKSVCRSVTPCGAISRFCSSFLQSQALLARHRRNFSTRTTSCRAGRVPVTMTISRSARSSTSPSAPCPFYPKRGATARSARIAIVTIGGTIYELNDMRQCLVYQPHCGTESGRGFGLVDIVWDAAGAAAVELVEAGIKKFPFKLHF